MFVLATGAVAGGGSVVFTRPELGSTMSDEASTASNWPAGMVSNSSSISLSQPLSAVPPKNQFEPLSATINPCFFMARKITCVSGLKPEMSKPDFRRKRAPMGGKVGGASAGLVTGGPQVAAVGLLGRNPDSVVDVTGQNLVAPDQSGEDR